MWTAGLMCKRRGGACEQGFGAGCRPEMPSQPQVCLSCPVRCFLFVFKSLAEGTVYGLCSLGCGTWWNREQRLGSKPWRLVWRAAAFSKVRFVDAQLHLYSR